MSISEETNVGPGQPFQDRCRHVPWSGTSEKFEYTPLSDPSSQIRLLRLVPQGDSTSSGDKVECSLDTFSLSEFQHLGDSVQDGHEYSALSYAWGSPEGGDTIICNGKMFPVWPNLRVALLYLRDLDWVDLIWIDAICINQSNNEEKSAQVSSMAQIYSCAKQTVVWLGEPQWGSAVQAVRDLHDAVPWDQMRNIFSQAQDDSREFNLVEALDIRNMLPEGMSQKEFEQKLSTVDWLSLYAPFCESWFSRKWIIQEVALARQVFMLYGVDVLDWTSLREYIDQKFRDWRKHLSQGPLEEPILQENFRNVSLLDASLPKISSSSDSKDAFFDRFQLGFGNAITLTSAMAGGEPLGAVFPRSSLGTSDSTNTFEGVLLETKNFNATDIRDSFYSVLSLCSRENDLNTLRPDYSLEPLEVLWQALNVLIEVEDHKKMCEYAQNYWCSLRVPAFERRVILPATQRNASQLSNPLSWLSFYKRHRSQFQYTRSIDSRRTLIRIYGLLIKVVNLYFKPQRGVDARWNSLTRDLLGKWGTDLGYSPHSLGIRRHSIIEGEPVDIWAHVGSRLDPEIRFQRRRSI